jgi:CheY-like chemotaxis protein
MNIINEKNIESPLILLVEDNEQIIRLLELIFKTKGFRWIVTKDGETALKIASQQRPDLIIMDIQLPKMDGLTVTRKIRSWNNYQQIPIVALTAYAMEGDRERALAAGCTEYIAKPLNTRIFSNLLDVLIVKSGRKLEI